jgi:hypothetical protein
MELLQFLVTPQGTLGERREATTPSVPTKKAVMPGAALAALAEDDEDWDEDAPDVRAEFASLKKQEKIEKKPQAPLTADFAPLPDGTLTLVRWPRLAQSAVVPSVVEGRRVTAIAATAFAATHLEEHLFAQMYQPPISFSVFCMKMGRYLTTEAVDEGGPTAIILPTGIHHIGPYAFWHCTQLRSLVLPDDIEELPVGVFGECSALEHIELPKRLIRIGYLPGPTEQVMPDVGAFAGCHALKELTLPAALTQLGAHTFNSAGLVRLTVQDTTGAHWGRAITAADSAFDHTAALLWLEKTDVAGAVQYRLGLPPARDKILAGDCRFGAILHIPTDYLSSSPEVFDRLAQTAFRLDFSTRMALARLKYTAGLAKSDRAWYRELLVRYFDRAPQFMPQKENSYEELFAFLCTQPDLTAADMSALLHAAGLLALPVELLAKMIEVRTQRFSTVTGFEDLELE